MKYNEFLETKIKKDIPTGVDVDVNNFNPSLFSYQRDIVRWALKRGRAAIFADCGLGKSLMELEWGTQVPGDVLLLAPLAVGPQTVREAEKFNIDSVGFSKDGQKMGKITVTNFDNWEKYNPDDFNAVILDESSILKNENGKMRNAFIEQWQNTPFRLAGTATPSPNDFMELGNHSEFLGIMDYVEVLAMYFIHDGGETQKWRLKGHGVKRFWEWVAEWAVYMRNPNDLGYSCNGFDLPPLNINEVIVPTANNGPYLFQMAAKDLQERITARRETIQERAEKTAELIKGKGGKWIVWCNLNAEADAIRKLIPEAVEVRGSDKDDIKADRLLGFSRGDFDILVTKPKVAGLGMNWQHCHQVAFVGLSDSYEQYYQAIRRCWRYGQTKPVDAYLVVSDREGSVLENIKRKDKQAEEMAKMMTKNMQDLNRAALGYAEKQKADYKTEKQGTDKWTAYHGDCVDVVSQLPDESVHYSIFSPPFASLYTYSNSDRDMGNCSSHEDFYKHFGYLVNELHRVIMPRRLVSFHCMNLPTSKQNDGFIGIRDFRGNLIKLFEDAGFVFHSEVCIWKDPVTAMQRTKAIGLLHKQLKKDSALSRQGIPDYLVTMRKLGDNPEPVSHTNETFPVSIWQRYASPVWMDINPNDTLQYRNARENDDERHICPLQLGVIERGIDLWTNPGDLVLSPFMGIGSEGYVALKKGRRFVGVELKESYYNMAIQNLKEAEENATSGILPGLAELV